MREITDWLGRLGLLTAVNMPAAEARIKAQAYAPMLDKEFAKAFFTEKSLAFVARRCKWFPSYGELCEALSAWRSDSNFGMPSAPPSDAPRLTGPSGNARPRVTILELVEHEMGYRPLRWTDYGVYPYTAEDRAAAEADVAKRLEYRRTAPPPAETVRMPAVLRNVALKGQALAAARAAAGIRTPEPPDPFAHPHATAALAVAPAMREAAKRARGAP